MITTTVAGRTWHYSHALGRNTREHNGKTGGFFFPVAVALAPDDFIFVLSRGRGFETVGDGAEISRRIGKLTIDEDHIGDFARNEFTWPAGLAVAKDGNVYCSDEYENLIAVFDPDAIIPFPEFDPDGERLSHWGETGSEEGQLNGPSGLAFDGEDNLYVVDSRNHRVQKFTKDGQFIMGWGTSGDGEGQFNLPWGITVDHKGDVYVADWGNNRVQKFSPDGRFLVSFGSSPEDGGDLDHPADVAVDSEGDVYVTDWGNSRVQIYDPDGDILTALHGDATKLSKAGEYVMGRDSESIKTLNRVGDVMTPLGRFGRTTGIAIDEQDRIIITDSRGRLQVYAKDKDYVEPNL